MDFDANGDLETIREDAQVTTLDWDARNHLINITGPGITAVSTYDAFGRRTRRQMNLQSTGYLYDHFDTVQDVSGGLAVNLLRSLRIDEPLVRNGKEYYLRDALGSVIAVADPSASVNTTYTYDPFGKTNVSGQSSSQFGYTSRESDLSDLYYYRLRYYAPEEERFISEDPMIGVVNRYEYVGASPTNFTDPTGLDKRPTVSDEITDVVVNTILDIMFREAAPCGGGAYSGAPRDCSRKGAPPGANGLQRAFAEHDRRVAESGAPFYDFTNERIQDAFILFFVDWLRFSISDTMKQGKGRRSCQVAIPNPNPIQDPIWSVFNQPTADPFEPPPPPFPWPGLR
jgi:RHS repeat-associated protein